MPDNGRSEVRTPILAITFALLLVPPADAQEMADIQPSTNTLLEYALTPASQYWAARGEHLPSKPEVFEYEEQDEDGYLIAARGALGEPRIYWNRAWLNGGILQGAKDPWRAMARQSLNEICQTATHEWGHNLGHGHTDITDLHNYDVMAADSGSTIWTLTDGTRVGGYTIECRLWSDSILRDRTKRTRVRRARAR